MYEPLEVSETARRRGLALVLGAALAAGALAPPAVSFAAEVTAGEVPAGEAGQDALARRIEARYRVLPTREGLVLEPREEVPGIRSIEVAGGEVAINGEPVAPGILRSWLGAEAEPLLDLADLAPEEARALLAVPAGAEGELVAPGEESLEEESGEPMDGEAADEVELAADDPDEVDGDLVYLGERFSVGGSVTVEEHEVASEVVVIGGAVHILGRVDGDVVAVGGPVSVDGAVDGDVVAVGGGVVLGPKAEVDRDVVSVGGGIRKSPQARVGGQVTEAAFPWVWGGGFDWSPGAWDNAPSVRAWAIGDAMSNLMLVIMLALFGLLVTLIARGTVERAATRLETDLWSSIATGLATLLFLLFGLPVVMVLLVLTVVGCLALPLVPVLLLFVALIALVGYTAAALQLGRLLGDRFGWRRAGVVVPLLLGLLAIELWRLVGDMLQIPGGPVSILAMIFLILGALIEVTAWVAGLGAMVMNLFADRPPRTALTAGPVPPPPLPPAGPSPEAEAAAAAIAAPPLPPATDEVPPPTAADLPPEAAVLPEEDADVEGDDPRTA